MEAEGYRPRPYGFDPFAAVAARRHGARSEPRSYAYQLPRKMQLGALRSALSAKLRDGELKIVQAFDMPDHKTKIWSSALRALEATRKVLLVDVLADQQDGERRTLIATWCWLRATSKA